MAQYSNTLIQKLEMFGNRLESQIGGQPVQPEVEEVPERQLSPEAVLDNWMEFNQGKPSDDESLNILDSFLSGGNNQGES